MNYPQIKKLISNLYHDMSTNMSQDAQIFNIQRQLELCPLSLSFLTYDASLAGNKILYEKSLFFAEKRSLGESYEDDTYAQTLINPYISRTLNKAMPSKALYRAYLEACEANRHKEPAIFFSTHHLLQRLSKIFIDRLHMQTILSIGCCATEAQPLSMIAQMEAFYLAGVPVDAFEGEPTIDLCSIKNSYEQYCFSRIIDKKAQAPFLNVSVVIKNIDEALKYYTRHAACEYYLFERGLSLSAEESELVIDMVLMEPIDEYQLFKMTTQQSSVLPRSVLTAERRLFIIYWAIKNDAAYIIQTLGDIGSLTQAPFIRIKNNRAVSEHILLQAIRQKNIAIVQTLLNQGVSLYDSFGTLHDFKEIEYLEATPLSVSIEEKATTITKTIVNRIVLDRERFKAKLIFEQDLHKAEDYLAQALLVAIVMQHVDIITLLIRAGARIEERTIKILLSMFSSHHKMLSTQEDIDIINSIFQNIRLQQVSTLETPSLVRLLDMLQEHHPRLYYFGAMNDWSVDILSFLFQSSYHSRAIHDTTVLKRLYQRLILRFKEGAFYYASLHHWPLSVINFFLSKGHVLKLVEILQLLYHSPLHTDTYYTVGASSLASLRIFVSPEEPVDQNHDEQCLIEPRPQIIRFMSQPKKESVNRQLDHQI